MMILGSRLVNARPPPIMRTARIIILLAMSINFAGKTLAGEVSGLPTTHGPATAPDYSYFFGNDFAAIGTSDDFRTGQMTVTGRFGDSWVAVIDHSIFTRQDETGNRFGRVDTMTLSLGYDVVDVEQQGYRGTLTLGGAIRGIGDFEGERMQNGFHRLVRSEIERLEYTDTEQTDAAAWALGEYRRVARRATGQAFLSSWDLGYWARAGAFLTADGQLDAVAGLYATAERGQFDLWMGVRHDWRSGYGVDFVLSDAADEESKPAIALGARFGALVVETVQRFDSSASYGQISFVSSSDTRGGRSIDRPVQADLQATLQVPHITLALASRWYRRMLVRSDSAWKESLQVEIRAGQPQRGSDPSLFVETVQATFGMEVSRALTRDWLRYYANVGAGLRSERLLLRDEDERDESENVIRGVAAVDTGLEIDAVSLSRRSRLRLRIGVSAWLPFGDSEVDIAGRTETVQAAGSSLVLGWVMTWH